MNNYNFDPETIYFITSKARVSTDERLKFMLAYSLHKCEPIRKIYEDEFNRRMEERKQTNEQNKMEHTMSCEYPEGCSCGATKWNKLTDDPIVDSKGNTLSSYLLSGELPPLSFFKKEHDLEVNKILKEKDDKKKVLSYVHEMWSWVFDENGSGTKETEEKHIELENKYGKGTRELARKYIMDNY